jgi:hypothetical protein
MRYKRKMLEQNKNFQDEKTLNEKNDVININK